MGSLHYPVGERFVVYTSPSGYSTICDQRQVSVFTDEPGQGILSSTQVELGVVCEALNTLDELSYSPLLMATVQSMVTGQLAKLVQNEPSAYPYTRVLRFKDGSTFEMPRVTS